MYDVDPIKTGLTFGFLFGLGHLFWSALVAVHWAKPVIDFVLRLHSLKVSYEVLPFDLGAAALLVTITTLGGFTLGLALAFAWNWFTPTD